MAKRFQRLRQACEPAVENIFEESVQTQRLLLVIRDGSRAIRSAVTRAWPTVLQQTGLVHIERTILDRMRYRDRSESTRLFKILRQAQGKQASEDLREFVAERNASAALTLTDSRDEILCVQRLEVPSTLNITLLSMNCIENIIRNWREHTNNIERWDVKQDMLERWMATGLLWAETGCRRIRHYEDLRHLKTALERPVGDCAPESGATAPDPSTPSPTDEAKMN